MSYVRSLFESHLARKAGVAFSAFALLFAGMAVVLPAVSGAQSVDGDVTPVSASDDGSNDGHTPSGAIDEDLDPDSRWSSKGTKSIEFDLGSETSVENVSIAWYNGDTRKASFSIDTSADGSNWTSVLGNSESSGTTLDLERFDVTDTSARYVRINGMGNTTNNWNAIVEVTVGVSDLDTTTPEEIDYSENADRKYISGEIFTLEEYLYGSVEVRMKVAEGSGIVNGFFTYKNGSEIAGTPWEEIDMEVLGKDNATILQTNVITGTSAARITSEASHVQPSLADDFHVYRMDWYEDRVEFFLDGEMLSRAGKENMTVDQFASLTSPQGLRLNLWPANIDSWVGPIDNGAYPASMEVDYMSYSSLNTNTGNFTLEWKDGFESINSSRFGLADWTFSENDAKFNPSQVTTDGDILKISLDNYKGQ